MCSLIFMLDMFYILCYMCSLFYLGTAVLWARSIESSCWSSVISRSPPGPAYWCRALPPVTRPPYLLIEPAPSAHPLHWLTTREGRGQQTEMSHDWVKATISCVSTMSCNHTHTYTHTLTHTDVLTVWEVRKVHGMSAYKIYTIKPLHETFCPAAPLCFSLLVAISLSLSESHFLFIFLSYTQTWTHTQQTHRHTVCVCVRHSFHLVLISWIQLWL